MVLHTLTGVNNSVQKCIKILINSLKMSIVVLFGGQEMN